MISPAEFPGGFEYVEADMPLGMTASEFRRARARQARQRGQAFHALAMRLGRAAAKHPAICAACVLGVHVGHVALGAPALEGLEGVLLQAAQIHQPSTDE